jgi:serine phosphatase RsbU (regulator of sigma subunit)
MSRHSTPEALVEALHNRDEAARAQLREWLGDPVERLMQQLQTRHDLPHRLDRLTHHALHAAETYLRTRSPADFRSMNIPAFRGSVLIQVARQVVQPFGGGQDGRSIAPEPLPQAEGYDFRTVFLPSEKVGSFSFGGDWFGGRRSADGTLWLIVADVTGHGYAAYLLANTLPIVWRKCWTDSRLDTVDPADVLAAMHDLLRDCLPEDVYVECTLLRLTPNGRVTVAPAGGSRLLLRQRGPDRIDLLKLRGLWLGFERPLIEDQHTCTLKAGDELLLGTDGVFDQLLDYVGSGKDLVPVVAAAIRERGLSDAVEEVLQLALKTEPQKDDITVVTIRRL